MHVKGYVWRGGRGRGRELLLQCMLRGRRREKRAREGQRERERKRKRGQTGVGFVGGLGGSQKKAKMGRSGQAKQGETRSQRETMGAKGEETKCRGGGEGIRAELERRSVWRKAEEGGGRRWETWGETMGDSRDCAGT